MRTATFIAVLSVVSQEFVAGSARLYDARTDDLADDRMAVGLQHLLWYCIQLSSWHN